MSVNDERLCFTISLGVATIPTGIVSVNADEVLHRADALLYTAKHQGRNRVRASDVTTTASPLREA